MKKLLIAVLALAPMAVLADAHEEPICSHTMQYTILNEDGDVMDQTTYVRNWPLTCNQSLMIKYETLKKLVDNGEAQWKKIEGIE